MEIETSQEYKEKMKVYEEALEELYTTKTKGMSEDQANRWMKKYRIQNKKWFLNLFKEMKIKHNIPQDEKLPYKETMICKDKLIERTKEKSKE